MPLDGPRLAAAVKADMITQLSTNFPMPPGLLPAEQTAYTANQQAIADALSDPVGLDTVTEITTNAVAVVTGVTTGGSSSGPGTVS